MNKPARPLSTFLLSLTFRTKLKATLTAQVENVLNSDGCSSGELEELVTLLDPHNPETYQAFVRGSATSFRRFTETALTLIELEVGDMKWVKSDEALKERIAAFISGRLTRYDLFYVRDAWRLRKIAESANAHNDLHHEPYRRLNTPNRPSQETPAVV